MARSEAGAAAKPERGRLSILTQGKKP